MDIKNKVTNILDNSAINADNRFDTLLQIFHTLKKEGLGVEDFDSGKVGQILEAFTENSNLDPLLNNLNSQILIYEIKEVIEFIYSPKIEPKVKNDNIIDKSIELKLKPEDFPEKQYDEDYMKELGLDE